LKEPSLTKAKVYTTAQESVKAWHDRSTFCSLWKKILRGLKAKSPTLLLVDFSFTKAGPQSDLLHTKIS